MQFLSERSQSGKVAYYMTPTTRHSKKAKLWRRREEWLPGVEGGSWRGRDGTWDFEGSETPLSDTVMVVACHTFVQIQKILYKEWTLIYTMDLAHLL